MSNAPTLLETDDIINILENESTFYADWLDLAQRAVIKLFSAYPERGGYAIAFGWSMNSLSSSSKEIISSLMYQRIDNALRTLPVFDTLRFGNYGARDVLPYFMEKMIAEIQSGNVTLPVDVDRALGVIYGQQGEKVNVAQACRDTGKTRHAITTLMDIYPADAYRRYGAVQSGQRYEMVMGDCAPYIQNYPKFTPVSLVDRDIPNAPRIEAGDLVAQSGSDRWFSVSHLTTQNGLVFTDCGGILHMPVKHLPRQYRSVAQRFCSSVDTLPAREFAAQQAD